MKNFTLACSLVLIVGIFALGLSDSIKKQFGPPMKPYSVTITHGTPMISYSSTLQVDSVRFINNQSTIIYVNGSSLWVKADYITFKKN